MLQTGPHVRATNVAIEARNLPDMFLRRSRRAPDRPAFFDKRNGTWTPTSWQQWHTRSAQVAAGLQGLGLEPGDCVAILGSTRPEWAHYDIGAQLCGCVSMGIYPKQSADQVRYLLRHSEAKVVLVESQKELDVVLAAAEEVETLQAVIPWRAADADGRESPLLKDPSVLRGTPLNDDQLTALAEAIDPAETAIFVYTSGTTGPPKCAMISHGNILTVLGRQDHFLEFYEDDLCLSFLPMAHVAERIMAFYGRVAAGFPTAYASSIAAVLEELGEIRPTVFGSVPRIFEKAYNKIHAEVGKKPKPVQSLFAWASRVGIERVRRQLAGQSASRLLELQYAVADRLVFTKIRGAFGGRVRQFVTGAAPTPIDVLEFFWAAGLPIYEVYGMTEATVVTHANIPGQTRLGTVGQCVPELDQKIADDGEILLRGPLVFKGYYKDEEATAKTVIDGWLHTGDIGTLDADGYLKITDRKKHIIITAGGKNLTPANIEAAIKVADPLISHVHAHADKRPYVSALVVPSPIETLEFGCERGLVTQDTLDARTAELLENPSGRTPALAEAMKPVTESIEFQTRMKTAVKAGNVRLANVEKVKRFTILNRDFSQENGELTPTMKVKRKAVETEYAALFERMYTEDGFALEP